MSDNISFSAAELTRLLAPPSSPVTCSPVSPHCPSAGWLQNSRWIDGGIQPPHFYTTLKEMGKALLYYSRFNVHPGSSVAMPVLPMPTPPMPALPAPIHSTVSPSSAKNAAPNVEEVPLAAAGHMASALMHISSQVAGPASHSSKLVVRRAKLTKSDHIILEDATHCDFIKGFPVIHNLADKFNPGIHFGPLFKMYWT
ncbi:hypothetical protein PILCRDRAFT_7620 [Piloderma croceum F 1598]|uniref:Uncharacterized protein n=1 Tax=Piloderma croceum (strain F 1598) TaxID=765440 RepID=A0A0C3B8U9_PILCF|nr:hypothetical protein PILCRDRAFT_7620 [Piloderma croceum F 1598]